MNIKLDEVEYVIETVFSEFLDQWVTRIVEEQKLQGRVKFLENINALGDTMEESIESFKCDCAYYFVAVE